MGEGMAVAKTKGRLRVRKPKLSAAQEAYQVKLHRQGAHTTSEIAELVRVAHSTVYRVTASTPHPADGTPWLLG